MDARPMFVLHTVGEWGPLPRRLLEAAGGRLGATELGPWALFEDEHALCEAAETLSTAAPDLRLAMTAGPVLQLAAGARPSRPQAREVREVLLRAPLGALLTKRALFDGLAPTSRRPWSAEQVGAGWLALTPASGAPAASVFTWRATRATAPAPRGFLWRGQVDGLDDALDGARVVVLRGPEGAGKTSTLERWFERALHGGAHAALGWAQLDGVVGFEALSRRWVGALGLGAVSADAGEWVEAQRRLVDAQYAGGVVVIDQLDELGGPARAALVELIEGTPRVRWLYACSGEPLAVEGSVGVSAPALSGDEACAMLEASDRIGLPEEPGALEELIGRLDAARLTPGTIAYWLDGSPHDISEALETGELGEDPSQALMRRLARASRAEVIAWVALSRFGSPCTPEDVAAVMGALEEVELGWVRGFVERVSRTSWSVARGGHVVTASALEAIEAATDEATRERLSDAHAEHVARRAIEESARLVSGPDVPAQEWLEERLDDVVRVAWRCLERAPELGVRLVEALFALEDRDLTALPYVALLERAREVAEASEGGPSRELELARAWARRREHDREQWGREMEAALARCEEPGAAPETTALALRLYAEFLGKDALDEEGLAVVEGYMVRSHDLAQAHGLDAARGSVAHYMANHHTLAGRYEEVPAWLEIAREMAQRTQHVHLEMMYAYTAQAYHTHTNGWERARALAGRAMECARVLDHGQYVVMMLVTYGYAELTLGRHDEAYVAFRDAEALAWRSGYGIGALNAKFMVGVVELISGRIDRAVSVLGEAVEGYDALEEGWLVINALPWLAVAHEERRDRAAAAALWERIDTFDNMGPDMERSRETLRVLCAVVRGEEELDALAALTTEGVGAEPRVHLLRRHLRGAKAEEAEAPRAPDLVVSEAGGVFLRVEEGQVVDISHRRALRRLLDALVAARLSGSGALDRGALFEAGWPGEAALPESANSRVYVAVNTLRKLGLDGVLVRNGDGYVLDPSCHVVLGDPASFVG